MSIRQEVLEVKVVETFRKALTPEMIDYVVAATNQALKEFYGATPREVEVLTEEGRRVESELSNLIAFVAKGETSSPRLREEISAREQRLTELSEQLDRLRASATRRPYKLTEPGSRPRSSS